VSIIDLELKPPRVVDKVVVGDGPEGIAISPKGDFAVAVILAGSNNKAAFFHRPKGYVSVLRVDGKKVTKVKEIDVGGLPEAAVFTPDGKYLLVGNYLDPQGRRHRGHRHRPALQGARASRLGAGQRALRANAKRPAARSLKPHRSYSPARRRGD